MGNCTKINCSERERGEREGGDRENEEREEREGRRRGCGVRGRRGPIETYQPITTHGLLLIGS